MITKLFFADAHVESDDIERFEKLGRLIVDRQPDSIFDLGDFVSLTSISHWDMSKKLKMEGKRYAIDVENGRLAYDTLFAPLESLQEKQRHHKTKVYRPKIEKMDGNHEGWVSSYLQQNPELQGAIDLNRDLGLTQRHIPVHPYRERIVRDGINILHAPLAGNNQPISGLHVPHKALQRFNNHVVMGHYHRNEAASAKRVDSTGTHRAIICPAFFIGQPHYLSPNAPAVVDSGVILVHQEYPEARPEVEEISMERLFCEY